MATGTPYYNSTTAAGWLGGYADSMFGGSPGDVELWIGSNGDQPEAGILADATVQLTGGHDAESIAGAGDSCLVCDQFSAPTLPGDCEDSSSFFDGSEYSGSSSEGAHGRPPDIQTGCLDQSLADEQEVDHQVQLVVVCI